jgi:hypothetical protein
MENLISRLKADHPNLLFSPGRSHCWSPEHEQISYENSGKAHGVEGLLHELGHARLRHQGYVSDMELLKKEVDAWQEAKLLAATYAVPFDEEHMQDCLDTYREWIYKRSICPTCLSTGIQKDEQHYHCLNCAHIWGVTASRFCRPYRRSKARKI